MMNWTIAGSWRADDFFFSFVRIARYYQLGVRAALPVFG